MVSFVKYSPLIEFSSTCESLSREGTRVYIKWRSSVHTLKYVESTAHSESTERIIEDTLCLNNNDRWSL